MFNYYKNQIEKVGKIKQIKFIGDENNSNFLSLNNESLNIIIDELQKLQKLSLYQKILYFNIEFDTHCNDLYLYVTDETKDLINSYEFKVNVTTFKSAIDGRLMFDVPFAYEDYKR
jgi:hypothetical protein